MIIYYGNDLRDITPYFITVTFVHKKPSCWPRWIDSGGLWRTLKHHFFGKDITVIVYELDWYNN